MGSTQNVTATTDNWAGYAVVGRRGVFSSVSAAWIQPVAHCAGVVDHRYAAFWVGLDGADGLGGAKTTTVEQTGSDTDCRGRVPSYYGWYEMYPAAPVYFANPIRAGDHMSASVTFRSTSSYILVLRDATRRWTQRIVKQKTGLARASAEVIAEDPASSSGLVPLANFGTVRWTDPKVNGVLLRGLPRRVRLLMVDGVDLVKAQTSLVGTGDGFTNTYVRAS